MLKRVLGALWFEERIVFVDAEQKDERVLFTDAHEATHAICDWHADVLRPRYLLPNGALSIVEGAGAPLAEIVNWARLAVDPPSKGLLMPDLAGDKKTFVVEAFFNSYCNLISSRRAKAAASAKRVRLAS